MAGVWFWTPGLRNPSGGLDSLQGLWHCASPLEATLDIIDSGQDRRLGTLLVIVSALSYATLPIFLKIGYQMAPGWRPLDVVSWRFWMAAPVTWLLVALREPLGPALRRGWPMGLAGLIFVGNAGLTFVCLSLLPASVYALLFSLYPAVVAVISHVLGQKLPPVGWVAVGLALVGSALTSGGQMGGDLDPVGLALAVGAMLCYATYILVSSRVRVPISGLATGAWSMTGTAVGLGILAVFRGGSPPPPGLPAWGIIAALALIGSVLPIVTFLRGMSLIGPARASILSTLEPAGTVVLAALILGDQVGPVQVAGGILILGSVVLLQLKGRAAAHG